MKIEPIYKSIEIFTPPSLFKLGNFGVRSDRTDGYLYETLGFSSVVEAKEKVVKDLNEMIDDLIEQRDELIKEIEEEKHNWAEAKRIIKGIKLEK